MSSEAPRRPLPRHSSVWWSRIVWRWPVLVWLFMAVLAVWLYEKGGEYSRINGMVEVVTESIAPLETGRLQNVRVVPGETVEPETIVAEMDPRGTNEAIAILRESLMAERADAERQFLAAFQRLEEELRDHRLERASAAAELEVYRSELERLEQLEADGYVPAGSAAEVGARVAALEVQLALYPEFVAQLEEERAELGRVRAEVLADSGLNENGEIVSAELRSLERLRDQHFLRAQSTATVARIRLHPGAVVGEGDSIVDLTVHQPPRIIAFVNESDTRPVAVGDVLDVEPAVGGKRITARVEAISPNVLALPDRSSPLPDHVVRGRRLELVPLEELDLAPGSSVIVLLPQREWLLTSLLGGLKR